MYIYGYVYMYIYATWKIQYVVYISVYNEVQRSSQLFIKVARSAAVLSRPSALQSSRKSYDRVVLTIFAAAVILMGNRRSAIFQPCMNIRINCSVAIDEKSDEMVTLSEPTGGIFTLFQMQIRM